MAIIDYKNKIIKAKILYFGSGYSGKTANIKYIEKMYPTKVTGERVSIETETGRTQFFDFMALGLGNIEGFHTYFNLYSSPGQDVYASLKEIVLKDIDGLVFVVDSQREAFAANIAALKQLLVYCKTAGRDLSTIPIVIQYNKQDLNDLVPDDVLNKEFAPYSHLIFKASATRGDGVVDTLKAISKLVLAKIDEQLERDKIL